MCYNIDVRLSGTRDAGVAQSVEQLIRNQQVAGSNPATSSRETAFVLMTKAVNFFASAKNTGSAAENEKH